jgi:hypothetical protein
LFYPHKPESAENPDKQDYHMAGITKTAPSSTNKPKK